MPETAADAGAAAAATPADGTSSVIGRDARVPAGVVSRAEPLRYLGVVTSTGGPQALVRLFNDLGPDFPLPILLIQHITPAFIESFATWLESIVPFRTVIATDGNRPRAGHIYLPPADRHLLLGPGGGAGDMVLRLGSSPLISGQRPSGTVLFASMGIAAGAASVGVLLTGMGDDGADGLGALRRAGGYTIAEDASTAIVYGMPAAAAERGAAIDILPLPAIGPRIRECVRAHAYGAAAGTVTAVVALDSEPGRTGK
jgi:two-component system chemotaxis response regulator CheB